MRRPVRLPLEQLAPYLLATPPPSGPPQPLPPLDWATLFGNDRPVELEVGFGKGLFLLNAAQSRPEVNFLGVEIERKYVLFTATRVAKRNLANVRLATADARIFLRDRIPTASLQAVHVYFPDPWWKKRHHKRRVFTAEFALECRRILAVGGQLSIATDVEEYFEIITGLVAAVPGFTRLDIPARPGGEEGQDYLTNFERKAKQVGKPIHRALYQREPT